MIGDVVPEAARIVDRSEEGRAMSNTAIRATWPCTLAP